MPMAMKYQQCFQHFPIVWAVEVIGCRYKQRHMIRVLDNMLQQSAQYKLSSPWWAGNVATAHTPSARNVNAQTQARNLDNATSIFVQASKTLCFGWQPAEPHTSSYKRQHIRLPSTEHLHPSHKNNNMKPLNLGIRLEDLGFEVSVLHNAVLLTYDAESVASPARFGFAMWFT